MKRSSRGFTLVEILIVVIILGILAAIVIPQFTNASSDARISSVRSTLQTMRSQIELFKIQHNDVPPAQTALATVMLGRSGAADTTQAPGGTLGPYLQAFPVNPLNNSSVFGAAAGAGVGWVYLTDANQNYTILATDTTGTATMATY
jgi:general secretion pathway protein G